jgi:hypothetical protein
MGEKLIDEVIGQQEHHIAQVLGLTYQCDPLLARRSTLCYYPKTERSYFGHAIFHSVGVAVSRPHADQVPAKK